MKAVLLFLVGLSSIGVSAYERCYVENKAAGKTTCSIASNLQPYACVGPTSDGYVSCSAANGEPIDCILKEGRFREPKEVWCDMPTIPQSEAPAVSFVNAPRYRRNSASSGIGTISAGPKSTENCDAIITVGEGSWDFQRQYNMKVKCLKRKAAIEGVVPRENCDGLVTAGPGSWDEMFQQKRRQNCLDRQAGIEAPPKKTLICTEIAGLPGQSRCR